MAKTLIAFYSRRGENWVDGGVRFLPKGNNELIVEKIKALLPEADVFQIDTVKKYADELENVQNVLLFIVHPNE